MTASGLLGKSFAIGAEARWGFSAPVVDACRADESLLSRFNAAVADIEVPCQTHSLNVGVLTGRGQRFPETDAIVTRLRGVRIAVRTADCVPVVMYAPDIQAVAAVHAGWKGTMGGIVSETINVLTDMGADAREIIARIGACICADCYEVDEDLAQRFESAGFSCCVSRGRHVDLLSGKPFVNQKPHLDLAGANRKLLIESGVNADNVAILPLCTRHSSFSGHFFPSWRREPGEAMRLFTWIELPDDGQAG